MQQLIEKTARLSAAQASTQVKELSVLVPYPKKLSLREGLYVCDREARITANFPEAKSLVYLLRLCGLEESPSVTNSPRGRSNILRLTIGGIYDGRLEQEMSARSLVRHDGHGHNLHGGKGNHVHNGIAEQELRPVFDGEEAYALQVDPDGVRLASRSLAGMAMGLKTLAKLLDGRDSAPALVIQDAPAVSMRALHLCIIRPNDGTEKEETDPDSIKRMLHLAAMSGYRYVFLEFWGMFPYQRRPYAVWPNPFYSREVVLELIRHAREDLHITPLPAQNLTSHAGGSRLIARQHVVLDQRPDLAPMWMPGGWCYNTENPDTKAFIRDMVEELLEAFRRPPLMHTGCDKAFGFGLGSHKTQTSASLLFGKHISFLNEMLQDRGTRMVMWADMLYSSMDALYWKADPAIVNMLPRSILMNLWTHADPGEHWADVEFFESRGFQTIYSPFLDRAGVANMAKIAIRKPERGILQTTWHMPQSARPSVVYSGAYQWEGAEPRDFDAQPTIERWYYNV